jgi:hypothetical protein
MTTNDEREQQTQTDEQHPATRVEEDHHTLREQLDAVGAATSRTGLLAVLQQLPEPLLEHFELEEKTGGLYEDLRARRPALATELDALRAEHRVILDELDALCRQLDAGQSAEGPGQNIAEATMRPVVRWLDRIRRHEHAESGMIGEVYYTDEGGFG